ncbi:MAG: hypothetical protein SNJ29_09960 [Rikenellaceae bacterium]
MNENLLRDLHEAQIEEIATVKAAIAELAKKPSVTPADIVKMQMMIANIKIPEQDLSELQLYFYSNLTATSSNTNDRIIATHQAVNECNSNVVNNYKSIDKQLKELLRMQSDPTQNVKIHKLDLSSWRVFFALVGVAITSFVLSVCTYNLYIENERLQENDIKYRYIKMTIGTSGDYIDQIEEYVRNNPEGEALKNMKERVDSYEKAVADKLRAEEQARLRSTKAAELDKQIKELKDN